MSDAIHKYTTAKGYIQSAYLIMTNPARYSVPDDTTFMLSYHMLLGFAVELYLKAYLSKGGHDEVELRSAGVRHNLERLLELSEADGFSLSAAKNLVEYLNKQHGSFEYRYVKSDGSYVMRPQAEVFKELDELDSYVDGVVGASVSKGKTPSSGGWIVPDECNGWRLPA